MHGAAAPAACRPRSCRRRRREGVPGGMAAGSWAGHARRRGGGSSMPSAAALESSKLTGGWRTCWRAPSLGPPHPLGCTRLLPSAPPESGPRLQERSRAVGQRAVEQQGRQLRAEQRRRLSGGGVRCSFMRLHSTEAALPIRPAGCRHARHEAGAWGSQAERASAPSHVLVPPSAPPPLIECAAACCCWAPAAAAAANPRSWAAVEAAGARRWGRCGCA